MIDNKVSDDDLKKAIAELLFEPWYNDKRLLGRLRGDTTEDNKEKDDDSCNTVSEKPL